MSATPHKSAAIMWLVAAALAFIAAGIGFRNDGAVYWPTVAAGLFCLAVGYALWPKRSQSPPKS